MEALTTNREVSGSSPYCAKFTKKLSASFHPRIAGSFESRPILGSHNNKDPPLYLSHIALPGFVSPDVSRNASHRVTQAA